MLILVSSNRRPVYAQNILDLTAQPEGVIMHFRYSQQHVEPSLWDKISQSPDQFTSKHELADEEILSVFLDVSEDKDGKLRDVMVPVRFGSVYRIFRDASVVHVYYRVGQYLPVTLCLPRETFEDKDVTAAREKVESFNTETSRALHAALDWKEGGKYFCQRKTQAELVSFEPIGLLPKAEVPGISEQQKWEKLVWLLGSNAFFSPTIFYRAGRLLRLAAEEENRHRLYGHPRPKEWSRDEPYERVAVSTIRPWMRGFRLDRAVSHRLELYTFQLPILRSEREVREAIEEAAEITVLLNEKGFVGSGPATRMAIKYDSHPFDFQPVFSEADSLTKLKITAFPKAATAVEPTGIAGGANDSSGAAPKKAKYIPRCPEIELWLETVHNVRYLETAARSALTGLAVLVIGSGDTVSQGLADVLNALVIGISYAASCCYLHWMPMFVHVEKDTVQLCMKFLAYLCLMRAFIIAVRKLPTMKI